MKRNDFTTELDNLGEHREEIVAMLLPKIMASVTAVKKRYKLTDRRYTRRDFFRICAAEKIEIANTEQFEFMTGCPQVLGACMTIPGDPVTTAIYLRSYWAVEGIDLATSAHELAHFYLHSGDFGKPGDRLLKLSSSSPGERAIAMREWQKEIEADLWAEEFLKVTST